MATTSEVPASAAPQGASDSLLERRFKLTERGTTVRIEAIGGITTFLTMCYIVFINPAILSAAGEPFAAIATATALGAGIACIVMGLWANLPLALAPGLGLNAVVAFDLILGQQVSWQVGMACVVIEGAIALVLVVAGLREAVMRAVPPSHRYAYGVGIGLFLVFIGLRDGGLVINDPATGVAIGDLTRGGPMITLAGVAVGLVLWARGHIAAVLAAIGTTTVLGLIFGIMDGPSGVFDWPSSANFSTIGDPLSPDNLVEAATTLALVPYIFALFMTDFFDTIGTASMVGRKAELMDDAGNMEGLRPALMVDSGAAAMGGAMGTSSITSYAESAAGVGVGAKTGLATVVTGLLFLPAIFMMPIIALVGQPVPFAKDVMIYPPVSAALIVVGVMMSSLFGHIDWNNKEHAIPAFVAVAAIPLTFSIAAGIGLSVLAYVVVMLGMGKLRQIHPLMWVVSALFLLFFMEPWLSAKVF